MSLLKSAPSHGGSGPHQIHGSLDHISQPQNGIFIGSAVFVQLTCVPNTQTDTDHDTCNICSKAVCMWCSIIITKIKIKQGVILMGRNRTGPPCSVCCLTARVPSGRHGSGRPPTCPGGQPAALQTTTTTDASEQNIRHASNNRWSKHSDEKLYLRGADFWWRDNVMWHWPVWSIAAGCCSHAWFRYW